MTRMYQGQANLCIAYPPSHLYLILFELFKNSLRATVETHNMVQELPVVKVMLVQGEQDVSVRVSDKVGRLLCSFT